MKILVKKTFWKIIIKSSLHLIVKRVGGDDNFLTRFQRNEKKYCEMSFINKEINFTNK